MISDVLSETIARIETYLVAYGVALEAEPEDPIGLLQTLVGNITQMVGTAEGPAN